MHCMDHKMHATKVIKAGTFRIWGVDRLTESSVKVIGRGRQELSLSGCCVTDPCNDTEIDHYNYEVEYN